MACTSQHVGNPVTDSGQWALERFDSVKWVDDERVLFLGDESEGKPTSYLSSWALKLFHLSTGVTKIIERNVNGFLYASGNLSLAFREVGDGPAGVSYETRRIDEASTRQPRFSFDGRVVFYDRLNARVTSAERPGAEFGRYWKLLRDGDGALDYGPIQRTGLPYPAGIPFEHRGSDGELLATLDLNNDQITSVEYVEFTAQYFLYDRKARRELDDGRCVHPAHWFSPGNPIRHIEIPIPCDLLKSSGLSVSPSRAGYVINFEGSSASGGIISDQGLHLAGGDRPGRVLPGYVRAFDVSPDGCRVAAVQAESINASMKLGPTLKILDLCPKDGLR